MEKPIRLHDNSSSIRSRAVQGEAGAQSFAFPRRHHAGEGGAPAARAWSKVSRNASLPRNVGRITTRVVSRKVNGSTSGFAMAWRTCGTAACFNVLDTDPYCKLGRKIAY